MALKLNLVLGPSHESYLSEDNEKEHKQEAIVDEENDELQKAPLRFVIHVNNIVQSILSNVQVYINNQQIYNSNEPYANRFYFSNKFKAAISEYKEVLHCEEYDYEDCPAKFLEAPSS